jgi:hypothetical protein
VEFISLKDFDSNCPLKKKLKRGEKYSWSYTYQRLQTPPHMLTIEGINEYPILE